MSYMTIDAGWNTADVCTTYWRLYINDRAGAKVRLETSVVELLPGQIHFIPAWVGFSCLNDRELNHFYIHFDVIGLSASTVRRCFPDPVSIPLDPQSRALFEQLNTRTPGLEEVLTGKSLIYHALSRAVSRLPEDRWTDLNIQFRDPFNGLMLFIENNLSRTLRNRDLASYCNVSEDHFIKRFKSVMTVSPNHYLNERRITRAAEHLIYSDDTIDSIADQCGFPNRHYFTRVFSKFMGIPPAQFRKTSHR